MAKVAKRASADMDFGYAKLTATGIEFKGDLTFEEFETCGTYLKRVNSARNWWLGDWLLYGENRPEWGDKYTQIVNDTGLSYGTIANLKSLAKRAKFSHRCENLDWTHHLAVFEQSGLSDEQRQDLLVRADKERDATGKPMSVSNLRQLAKETVQASIEVKIPDGKYQCITIDPPWPVEKIEREERPNQKRNLDYPVMTLEQIEALPIGNLSVEDGTHLYLWVTQKFLPDGMRLVESWGFTYQCLMTWVKPTGMTPYSWMYNTEHVIFARRGSLKLEQLGIKLSFEAPVSKHSAKPEVFYEIVTKASPGPRLAMFERSNREGFTPWGNEVGDSNG